MGKHPKIDMPAGKWEKRFNLLSVLLIIASIIYVIQAYYSLPDTIAIHFKGDEADGLGSKAIIFTMPAIAVLCFVPMYFLSKAPHTFNYMVEVTEENGPRLYPEARLLMTVLNFEILAIFFYIAWAMVQSADGSSALGVEFILLVIFVPLVTIIYFIIRMNRLA